GPDRRAVRQAGGGAEGHRLIRRRGRPARAAFPPLPHQVSRMAQPGSNLRTDPTRLWDSLMEMARIGPGITGGNNRQTATDADAEARALLQRWGEAEGLVLSVDRMGNMFLRLEGSDRQAAPVLVGSHLDTQPTGGKYDGVLGVLAGLEVIRTIRERGL